MDFLHRLDPGRAGAAAAAAARPALPPLMASAPVPSLVSLGSRLASSYAPATVASPGATGAWPDGIATPPHEEQPSAGHDAPRAPVDGVPSVPVQAAPATPARRSNRALQPPRPMAQAASSSALRNVGGPLQGPLAEPSRGQAGPPELAPLRAPLRAATVAPWRLSGPPMAAPGQPLSAAALQARASASSAAIAAPAPALHVTIDRIEVRAAVAAPKPAPAPRQPKAPAVSLADYLRAGARSKAAP